MSRLRKAIGVGLFLIGCFGAGVLAQSVASVGTIPARSASADDTAMIGNGTTSQAKALTDCDAATSALTYDTTTNAFGCNTISASITGTDTQVLFFDGNNNPAGDADFTWNKTGNTLSLGTNAELNLASNTDGVGAINATGTGAQIQILAGGGSTTSIGGEIVIRSGGTTGAGNDAGQIEIAAGTADGGADGGALVLYSGAGSGAGGHAGDIEIRAGFGASSDAGGQGNVLIEGASVTTGNAGRVVINGGGGAGTAGYVEIFEGSFVSGAQFHPTSGTRLFGGVTLDSTLSILAAGVRLSAADGVLTLLGLGDGNDENLTLDFDNAAANEINIGTGTGVTVLDFGTITLEADYNSSDGTAGLTQTCAAAVTAVTVKDGLITAITCS